MPRITAEIRARRLLIRLLSPAQREDFELYGGFTVRVSGRGNFLVSARPMFNVTDIETRTCYCAAPEGSLPMSDQMLAQKLVLENDPERFFRAARRRREDEEVLPNSG